MTYTLLITLEILFWVLLVGGLLARYLLHKTVLSTVVLALAPLTDLALLGFTVVDLHQGGSATLAHALAIIFVAVSVTSGKLLLAKADHLVQRVTNPEMPRHPRVYGKLHAHVERQKWFLHALAFLLGSGAMLGADAWVNVPARTQVLLQTVQIWAIVLVVDFLISFSYAFWPKSATGAKTR